MVSVKWIHIALLYLFPFSCIHCHFLVLCFQDFKFTISNRFFLFLKSWRFVFFTYLLNGFFFIYIEYPHECLDDLSILIFKHAILIVFFFFQVLKFLPFLVKLCDCFSSGSIHWLLLKKIFINFGSFLL